MQPASTAISEFATAQPASLWVWMPSGASSARRHLADDAQHLVRQRAAVRVAQDDRVGAGLGGRLADLERVGRRRPCSRRRSARRRRRPCGLRPSGTRPSRAPCARSRSSVVCSVSVTCTSHALPKMHSAEQPVSSSARSPGSSSAAVSLRRVDAERRDHRLLEREVACALEELDVLGVGAGEAALDVVNAEKVELGRDAQLVFDRERQPLALGAVTKRGVVKSGSSRVTPRRNAPARPALEPLQPLHVRGLLARDHAEERLLQIDRDRARRRRPRNRRPTERARLRPPCRS